MPSKIVSIVTIMVVTVLFMACSKEKELPAPEACREASENTILLLKVDFMTNNFEGGFEQEIGLWLAATDSLPILLDFEAPADFGNISLYYAPTNDLLFDGSVIWMGKGEIAFPSSFSSPNSFTKTDTLSSLPDSSRFQLIFGNEPENYTPLWESLDDLCIVREYLKSNKKIGIFLYTPSVGIGDPNDWDWIVVMSK